MKTILVLPSSAGPKIVNTGDTAQQAIEWLQSTGWIFQKDGMIFRQVGSKLEILTLATLHTLLFEYMNVQQWAMVDEEPTLIPSKHITEPTLKAILQGHHAREAIPKICTVAKYAYMILEGANLIQLHVGYNTQRGGVLVEQDLMVPDVPLEEACFEISGLVEDFCFATPSDKSRAIAAFFSAAMRLAGIYDRHPLLAFEADLSQTGKTLLWTVICASLGIRYATVAQRRGGVGSFDESIGEKLVSGIPAILFDNLRGKVDSPYLESCLTPEDGTIEARVPGVRSISVNPRVVVFGLTSNNAELTTDLANRTMMIRLRKQPDVYQFKSYPNGDGIVDYIKSRNGYFQGCINSILRHWWENGAKTLPCTEHSFKKTMGALDFIVQQYFKLPPLLHGHRVALDRTTKPGMSWLRQIALKAASEWRAVGWTASQIVERCEQEGIELPGGKKELDTTQAAQQIGIILGGIFGATDTQTIDDVTISRSTSTDTNGRQRKIYTFTCLITLERATAGSAINPDGAPKGPAEVQKSLKIPDSPNPGSPQRGLSPELEKVDLLLLPGSGEDIPSGTSGVRGNAFDTDGTPKAPAEVQKLAKIPDSPNPGSPQRGLSPELEKVDVYLLSGSEGPTPSGTSGVRGNGNNTWSCTATDHPAGGLTDRIPSANTGSNPVPPAARKGAEPFWL